MPTSAISPFFHIKMQQNWGADAKMTNSIKNLNISSIGGIIGWQPFATAYHASKFAIEGFTESLRQELADFNINIVLNQEQSVLIL